MFLVWFLNLILTFLATFRLEFIVPPRCHLTLFFVMVDSLYCGLTLAMQDLGIPMMEPKGVIRMVKLGNTGGSY